MLAQQLERRLEVTAGLTVRAALGKPARVIVVPVVNDGLQVVRAVEADRLAGPACRSGTPQIGGRAVSRRSALRQCRRVS